MFGSVHRPILLRLLLTLLLLLPAPWTKLLSPQSAVASSVSYGSSGNCNNWDPHGWSWSTWSGYLSGDYGNVYGELDWWDGVEWARQLYGSKQTVGSSDYPTVDNYYGHNEQGTGSWQEWGSHGGSVFTWTTVYSQKNIWCGS